MPKEDVKEWAIQDETTGEWWNNVFGLEKLTIAYPTVYDYYPLRVAADISRLQRNNDLRIVPAPPREMTDEECWEWFRKDRTELALLPFYGETWAWQVVRGDQELVLNAPEIGRGQTPCDAIRAARKKLKSEK